MTKVDIRNVYNTSRGIILTIGNDTHFAVGDVVTDGNHAYKVKSFIIASGNPEYFLDCMDVVVEPVAS